jgi:hypothetical protein
MGITTPNSKGNEHLTVLEGPKERKYIYIYMVYFTNFSVPGLYSVEWCNNEYCIGEDLKGSGQSLTEEQSEHFPVGTEENHNELQL